MNKDEVLRKAEAGEGLTVEEIKLYQSIVKPVKHVYGKYGTLARKYLEDKGVFWTIADVPAYLHGIDRAAERMYDVMYEKLSRNPMYQRTENYIENVRRENAMKQLIEEEILNEIVYVY